MTATLPKIARQIERQANSLRFVVNAHDERLQQLSNRIQMLASSVKFNDAVARALSLDQVENSCSTLDSEISTMLSAYTTPRELRQCLELSPLYIDMLTCADRIRSLLKSAGSTHPMPFINSLPTPDDWLHQSHGSTTHQPGDRMSDYKHRINLLRERFKEIPGLNQYLYVFAETI